MKWPLYRKQEVPSKSTYPIHCGCSHRADCALFGIKVLTNINNSREYWNQGVVLFDNLDREQKTSTSQEKAASIPNSLKILILCPLTDWLTTNWQTDRATTLPLAAHACTQDNYIIIKCVIVVTMLQSLLENACALALYQGTPHSSVVTGYTLTLALSHGTPSL